MNAAALHDPEAFAASLTHARDRRDGTDDPMRSQWWRGYALGLRRAYHGDDFGTLEEHDAFLDAAGSDDPMRDALGRGYRAGLTGEEG